MVLKWRPKLIALDIDGTILDEAGKLTQRTETVLKKAIACGIKVILVTGRMYPSALPLIRKIGIDAHCVFYNGALVRHPVTGSTLYEKGLGVELTSSVVDFFHENDWYIQMYNNDNVYVTDSTDSRCIRYEAISKIKPVELGSDLWNFRVDSTKLLGVSLSKEIFFDMLNKTKERFGSSIHITPSWEVFVEIMHPCVNKAAGLEKAVLAEGVLRSDVMAVGDGYNDVEMLSWAGLGVAMGNAPSAVKAVSDIVTLGNDNEGAAAVIEPYL